MPLVSEVSTSQHWHVRFVEKSRNEHPVALYYGEYDTPFGYAACVVSDSALVGFVISEHKSTAIYLKSIAKQFGKEPKLKQHFTDDYVDKLLTPSKHSLGIDLIGTAFQLQVWKALLEIPAGQTRAYQDIAKIIGKPKAARAVGSAVGQNPICYLVPCHRVISSSGGIGGYSGGLGVKRKLLRHEGLDQF